MGEMEGEGERESMKVENGGGRRGEDREREIENGRRSGKGG